MPVEENVHLLVFDSSGLQGFKDREVLLAVGISSFHLTVGPKERTNIRQRSYVSHFGNNNMYPLVTSVEVSKRKTVEAKTILDIPGQLQNSKRRQQSEIDNSN